VITTIAGSAAIEATIEVVKADGTSTGRHPIELAIPAVTTASLAELDLRAVGIAEPAADES
jgi:hypothetical protein